ncbi:MAG: bifunctional phosphoribosyl-AMP cyclohydrolase/phosphoribosyl-ATP diphosphatase HisIE [Bacteroidales bacterium]|nr:bifunctional phosphoribosyl-AMP cyclohydrolase/phosphoribosyl-ATP diphosphatase HisIE [Candidatus Cryptobacteroides caccocaballi]
MNCTYSFKDFELGKTGDGLLPVIIQDSRTLKVLMLGYMNEEAYEKTRSEGKVTFWSRSRNTLWTKGETSGNFLTVVEMYPDCDNDTLLIKAIPDGPTCHRGTTSCFDTPEEEGFIRTLEGVIQKRHEQMPEGSYTTKLFIKGVKCISKKVGEETSESIIEAVDGNRDRFIYEASDLIYHYLVLLEQMGVSISDLEKELSFRHR